MPLGIVGAFGGRLGIVDAVLFWLDLARFWGFRLAPCARIRKLVNSTRLIVYEKRTEADLVDLVAGLSVLPPSLYDSTSSYVCGVVGSLCTVENLSRRRARHSTITTC